MNKKFRLISNIILKFNIIMASLVESSQQFPQGQNKARDPKSSFSNKPFRAPDLNLFVIGDEFTIPENFQVFTHIFNDHEVEYLRVK